MSATTTNLNLIKPEATENVDVSVLNENFEKIDVLGKKNVITLTSVCWLEISGNVAVLTFNGVSVSNGTFNITIPAEYRPKSIIINSALSIESGIYKTCFVQLSPTATAPIMRTFIPNQSTSGTTPSTASVYGELVWTL